MKKVINYGLGFLKNGNTVTHNVTSIHIDNFERTASFIIEKGTNVDVVKLSMEECQYLGILNIDKLENYCK